MDMDFVRNLVISKNKTFDLAEKLKKEEFEQKKQSAYLEHLPHQIWNLTKNICLSFYNQKDQKDFANDLSCLELWDATGTYLLGSLLTYHGHQLKIEKEGVHLKVSLIEMDGFLEKTNRILLFELVMTPLGNFLWKLEPMLLHEVSVITLSAEELFLLGSSLEKKGVLHENFF